MRLKPVPWVFGGFELLLGLIAWIIWLFVALWVYNDAKRRYPEGSAAPLVWAILVFIAGPSFWLSIGVLILYLLVRPPKRGGR